MYLREQTRELQDLPAVTNTHTKLKCLLTKCAGSAFHFLRALRNRRSGPRMRLQLACIFFRPRSQGAASRRCGSFVCHRLLLILYRPSATAFPTHSPGKNDIICRAPYLSSMNLHSTHHFPIVSWSI